jgi:subtilisin family serine protease
MALVGFETAHVLANTEYLLAQKARGVNVRAVNMSFGTGIPYSRAIEEALAKLEEGGVLVFAAAGNFATDNDFASFSYPSSLPFGNIVSVGSTGGTDEPSNFSQWGRRSVDIHAPGEAILSTIPSNTFPTATHPDLREMEHLDAKIRNLHVNAADPGAAALLFPPIRRRTEGLKPSSLHR